MRSREDPVQKRDDGDSDRHGVVDWTPHSVLDRGVLGGYTVTRLSGRLFVVVLGVLILAQQLAPGEFSPETDSVVIAFVILSMVPAFLLAAYIWYADITGAGPIWLLIVTFGLGIVFASYAAIVNATLGRSLLGYLSSQGIGESLAMAVLFVAVVGPAEELVKLAAVRFQASRTRHFDSVISGAVYGAAAGLGFAAIENAFYIVGVLDGATGLAETLTEGGPIASARALAAPGHVIWSAIAGYHLGLARFNSRYAGPIVFKGLAIAILAHAVYNVIVTTVPVGVGSWLGVSPVAVFFSVAIAYNGLFFIYVLYLLSAYRDAHRDVHDDGAIQSELTEFDP